VTPHNRSVKELAGYFVLGIAISFVTTAIFGNLNLWIRLAVPIVPSIFILAVRKNFKSRGFLSSIGHTIPYSIAMFVLEQPLIKILEDELPN